MTVVTQFLGSGSDLRELKRFYIQDGKVIPQPQPTIPGMTGNSITQEWCNTQQKVFAEEVYPFNKFGGMASMGRVSAMILRINPGTDSTIGYGKGYDSRHV